ncbi:MAG: EscU/YscU/HrcU family type III secretion system export apparatus switch protein [Legionella sp.]|nr:EscU/YscU/HrcU family type III secretion system export apparatus switch protein [Legionella sp.]
MSEKTEKATPYKLQKAKEKGQVSKSVELTTCISLLVLLGMITALWPKKLTELQDLVRQLFYFASHLQFSLDNISHLNQFILTKIINLWLPFALTGCLAVILASLAQTGIVWSTTPLIPDFKRLNVIQGFKKIWSLKTYFETLKSTLKLFSALLFLFLALKHQVPNLLQLALTPPSQHPVLFMHFLLKLMFQLLLLLAALAVIDKLYTRWNYAKDQKMSKQEVKDEYKQREGDPKVKSKIKQLQQQLRQKTASLKQVKTADVVITNPTHLAIALKYDRGSMPAPQVVCKAKGEMVVQVKELARKHGVPIIENKFFARMLYHSVDLNQWISKELYPIAAGIFKEIYARKKEAL